MPSLGTFQLGDTRLGNEENAAGGEAGGLTTQSTDTDPTAAATAGAEPVQATGDVVLSDSASSSTAAADTATLTGAGDIATAITSTIAEVITQTLIGSGVVGAGVDTQVLAFGSPQTMSPDGAVSDPFTEAVARAQEELGGFQLGEARVGESPRLTSTLSTSTEGATADTSSTGGETTTLTGGSVVAAATTSTVSAAQIATMSPAAVVATAVTETVAGALVQTMLGSGAIATGFETKATAFGSPSTMDVGGAESDPFTEAIAKNDLELGDFVLGGGEQLGEEQTLITSMGMSTFGDSLAEGISGNVTGLDTDTQLADSFSASTGGETTLLSMNRILSDSLSEALANATVTAMALDPIEAIRFLPDWSIFPGPRVVQDTQEEVRTHDTLTITWRVTEELLVDVLRPQLDQSGKVDVVERIDGGFDAVPRAQTANEIQLQPATGREDIRPITTYYVDDYEETPRGTGAGEWEVEVELVPEKEKAHDNEHGTFNSEPTETDDPNLWLFEFDFGDVLSRRVSADVQRSPNDTISGASLNIVVLKDEARVIEENAGKLGAVNLRDVPDGIDLLEDVSTGNRNTVTISPPDVGENTVQSGDYVIEEFETTWNQAAYVIELNVSKL